MTLSLAKSTWSLRERLLYTDLNLLVVELLKAVDGNAGGTISPSAPLIVDGSSGLQVTGSGGLTVSGTGGLTVSGSGTAARVKYASRSVTRARRFAPEEGTFDSTYFSFQNGGYFVQGNIGSASVVESPINGLPNGATLTAVTLALQGAITHGGAPATMPTFRVYYRPYNSITRTQIGSTATDPYTSQATYDAMHTLAVSGLSHTIDTAANTYHVVATGEAGANSIVGLTLAGFTVTCTITDQPEY